MAMKVVSIKNEKVLDASKGKMKVVSAETEKVLDTNSNIYLKRAEENLKNGRYDEALEEASLAVKYSNNNQSVVDQYNRIKNVLNEKKSTYKNYEYNKTNNASSNSVEYDARGFIKNTDRHKNGTLYDNDGYNKKGLNENGFNKFGYHENGTKYDANGYDMLGYDKLGFNKEGYNKNGYNREGLTRYKNEQNIIDIIKNKTSANFEKHDESGSIKDTEKRKKWNVI